jgi:hypothetical protein
MAKAGILGSVINRIFMAGIVCVLVFFLTVCYVIFPFDIIPDVIPVLGQMDDAAAIITALLIVPSTIVFCIGDIAKDIYGRASGKTSNNIIDE